MKLAKVSKQFPIFLSGEKDERKNKSILLKDGKVFYRFMNRLYIPEHVTKLSPEFVKELNNVRERHALTVVDEEYNKHVINSLISFVELQSSGPVNVLDFGCGNGYAGNIIRSRLTDSQVFGFDIRKPLERKLLKNYADTSFKSVTDNLPYATEFFDVVASFFVFHFYISDFQIGEIARVLKKDGIFFINLINSADFDVVNRLTRNGFSIDTEEVYETSENSGYGYYFRKIEPKS